MRRFLTRSFLHPSLSRRDGVNYASWLRHLRTEVHSSLITSDHQFAQLKTIVEHAHSHSPFYQRRFAEYGFDPARIQSLDDLRHAPILEKLDIAHHGQLILATNYPRSHLVASLTGGTTGNPFVFYRDRSCHSRRHALTHLANEQLGWRIGDPTAVLWNAHSDFEGRPTFRRRLRRVLECSPVMFDASVLTENRLQQWLTHLIHSKTEVLYGYAQSIVKLARYSLAVSRSPDALRIVVTTAEPLYPNDRRDIEKAFHCRVYNRYASREHGPMAQEFSTTDMHYYSNSIFLEIDESPEAYGSLLVTDLWNFAFPLIRYRIGDVCEERPELPDSSGNLPRLGSFSGRETDFLIAADGSLVSGMTAHDMFVTGGLPLHLMHQLQFEQDRPRHVIVRVVPAAEWPKEEAEEKLSRFVKTMIGDSIDVTISHVDSIPRSSSGKYRFTMNTVQSDPSP